MCFDTEKQLPLSLPNSSIPGMPDTSPATTNVPVRVPTKFGKLASIIAPIVNNGLAAAGESAPPGTFLRGYAAGATPMAIPSLSSMRPLTPGTPVPQLKVSPSTLSPISPAGPPNFSAMPPLDDAYRPMNEQPPVELFPVRRALPPNFGGGEFIRPQWEPTSPTPRGAPVTSSLRQMLVNTDPSSPNYLRETPMSTAQPIAAPPAPKASQADLKRGDQNAASRAVSLLTQKYTSPPSRDANGNPVPGQTDWNAALAAVNQAPESAIPSRIKPLIRAQIREAAKPAVNAPRGGGPLSMTFKPPSLSQP